MDTSDIAATPNALMPEKANYGIASGSALTAMLLTVVRPDWRWAHAKDCGRSRAANTVSGLIHLRITKKA
jgi:hypothetical protein